MQCTYCQTNISEKANFCSACKKQVKCLSCSEELEKNAEICVICGLETKSQNIHHNTIEFTENEDGRSFKATFSNEVGQSIGEALGIIILGKKTGSILPQISTKINDRDNVEDADFSEIPTPELATPINTESIKKDKISEVFHEHNNKTTLNETRLKANSKRDFSIRLTILYIHYRMQKGDETILRSDLTSIMKDASVEDGNWRAWLGSNNLVGVHDEHVELKAPGRELAKQYLNEIFDTNFDDKWKLGSSKPVKRSKKKEDETEE